MTVTLTLPLPPKGLRPNDRCIWQKKHRLTQQAREQGKRAMFTAIKSIDSPVWFLTGYRLYAYFSSGRWWDANAVVGGFKPYEDGISDACGQNDRTFELLGVHRFTDKQSPRLEVVLEVETLV